MKDSTNSAAEKPGDSANSDKARGASGSGTQTDKAPPSSQFGARKRPPGTKEVIPFQWKLMGESQGFALTLFKAIERDEVEAQLERVHREGYYVNLRILDVNEKVIQPTPPKTAEKTRKAGKTKAVSDTPKSKRTSPKVGKAKRAAKASGTPKTRPAAKAAKAKTARKIAKKKTTPKKSAKKRTSRKKK